MKSVKRPKMTDRSNNDFEQKNAVYYDGSCPMCTAIVNKFDNSTKGDQFSMRDITSQPFPQDFTKQDVEKEIYVVDGEGAIYRNAAAILKMLEAYPAWRPLVWIGRLPLIRNILPIGYNFVAANRHFLFGPAARIYWLKIAISLGFMASILLSLNLWISARFFPLTPVLNIFPPIPYPFDWILPLVLLALLAAIVLFSKPKYYVWAAVAVVAVLAFLDQQRIQPWVFQYAFMLAALGLFSWRFDDSDGRNATLNISRLIVASIYFWSGLQKLNVEFITDVFPWMISPITRHFPNSTMPAFYVFSALVPFIEMGIGIGLLSRRFRNIAIGLALAMCALVLSTIGPFGHNWNSVVWPWNITMVLLVFILFAKTNTVPLREILWVKNGAFHKIVLLVFGAMPLFYFFNIWDSYPSWSLYSGTTNDLDIYLSDKTKALLPAHIQKVVEVDEKGRSYITISEWSIAELNVPPYPETRIYRNVARQVCKATGNPSDLVQVVSGRLSWFNRDGKQTWTCEQLKSSRN